MADIDIESGVAMSTHDIEIEVSFGATKGLPNYSSERADQRIRMTLSIEGERVEDQLNELVKYENILHNHLVYAIAEALGLEAGLNEGGTASLIFPEPAPMPAPAPPPAQPQAPTGGGGGGTSGGRGPSKATREQIAALPRWAMDFGNGMKMYIDQRPLKAAGTYSPNAADFKEDVPNGDGKWIKDQNGNLVQETQRAMAASNVV